MASTPSTGSNEPAPQESPSNSIPGGVTTNQPANVPPVDGPPRPFLSSANSVRRFVGPEKEGAVFEEFLAAIQKHQVPLAAFWVLDLDQQKKDWNVNFENERKYMIELVGKANEP